MSCWQTWLYAFDCKSKEGSSNLPQDSVKKLFETGEFDSEETVINQKICDKQIGALAEWILCTGVKSRGSWFNSTEHRMVIKKLKK